MTADDWMIDRLPPAEVAYAEIGSEEVGALFVEEELIVAKAVSKRRAEFIAGRECARRYPNDDSSSTSRLGSAQQGDASTGQGARSRDSLPR